MKESSRDLVVAATLAAVALGGLAFAAVAEPTRVRRPAPEVPRLSARATFCPPPVDADGARTDIAVASAGTPSVVVRIDPGGRDADLAGGGLLLRPAARSTGSAITGFGGQLQAGARSVLSSPRTGAGAAACSAEASDRWHFAEGSSDLGADQRLLLYNPFLDEAVLRVVFHTPEGAIAKAALADVAVPAGRTVEVAANDFVLRESLLATSVLVTRGRVVAWRVLLPQARDGSGVQMSLGAPAASTDWYFPFGSLGPDSEESIALVNPGLEESVVSVTLATDAAVQQPRGLVELSVPPESARRLRLGRLMREPRRETAVSASVTSVNGVEVVAERTVVSRVEGAEGITSEVGATRAASSWVLPPPVGRSGTDSVELMNPGSEDADVTLALLREGRLPLRPRALARIEVPAGLRTSVEIGRWSSDDVLAVSVDADVPVVAERWARANRPRDAAAALGVPVTPFGPR